MVSELLELNRFTDKPQQINGELAFDRLIRLSDHLIASDGNIQFCLQYGYEQRWPFIVGKIQGNLPLCCQRCLSKVSYPINREFRLRLLTETQASMPDQKDIEVMIIEDKTISIVRIIEEELLLSLPLVAKHENDECSINLSCIEGNDQRSKQTRLSPFAILETIDI